MEYRYKRRRRNKSQGSNGTVKAIIALVMAGALVYYISTTSAGEWVSKSVIAPLFVKIESMISKSDRVEEEEPELSEPDTINLEQEHDGTVSAGVSRDIVFPALDVFALQMGVFGDRQNAVSLCEELKSMGAGGYLAEDEGRYRVLAAAYSDKASLDSVRENLSAQGVESTQFRLTREASKLRITAGEDKLNSIESAFNTLNNLVTDMTALALEFDKNSMTIDEGKSKASSLLERTAQEKDNFNKLSPNENDILSAALTCFSEYESALSELALYQGQSTLDFTAEIKYTQLSIIYAYDKLSRAITAAI